MDQPETGVLRLRMFYDVDVGQSDGRMFGGGAQDNGTVATLAGNITTDQKKTVPLTGKPDSFVEITGGDGGWILIDPQKQRPSLHDLAEHVGLPVPQVGQVGQSRAQGDEK